MIKSGKPLLGLHLSIAGGLYRALVTAQELDCTAVQIFTHSNRQWAFSLPTQQEAETFRETQKNSPIKKVIVHASYLMNPASPQATARKKAITMLKMELEACSRLKIPYLVLHPGSRLDSALDDGIKHCAESINEALEAARETKILIENMAGQGTIIGSKLEELEQIYNHIQQKDRVGFCFDTCHAFAAGYDFSTQDSYGSFWKKFDTLLGINKLHVIHMNDSLRPFESHVDRHTHIGQGKIGLEAFRLIMNDGHFEDVVKILETPKGNDFTYDKENLSLLRSLVKK